MVSDVDNSRIVINTWQDIIDYVVKHQDFDLIEAVAMHLVWKHATRRLTSAKERKARSLDQPLSEVELTPEEIDGHIYAAFDVDILDRYIGDAIDILNVYVRQVSLDADRKMFEEIFAKERASIVREVQLSGRFNKETAREKITEHAITAVFTAAIFFILYKIPEFFEFLHGFVLHSPHD